MIPTTYLSIAATEWTCADHSASDPHTIDRASRWDAARSLRSIAESLVLLTSPLRGAGDAINLVKGEIAEEMAAQRNSLRAEMEAQREALDAGLADQREALAVVVDELRARLRPESGAARIAREREERIEVIFHRNWAEYMRLCLAYKKAGAAHATAARRFDRVASLDAANLRHKLQQELTAATRAAFPTGLVVERIMRKKPIHYSITGPSEEYVGALDVVRLGTDTAGHLPAGLKDIRPVFAETPECVIEESFKV